MIKKEWIDFRKNWWLKVVAIAIIAIPSIYAGVFLGSIWDPYGNTGDIPVAVVNEDKEVTYNDETLAVGKELTKNLQSNDSMNFNVVSSDVASKGLKDGDYYMVITIPDNFSKNATTLLDSNPEKMVLDYTTNPGSSYIASKMDDSAIAKIKAEVSSTVTKTYAKTIFEQLSTIGTGMSDATDGTNQLIDGTNQLIDGNKTISDNLQVLANSSVTFQDGASTLTNGLKEYTDGVVTVNNGLYTLKDGISTLNDATPALASGIDQLDQGATTLNSGVSQYTEGVNTAFEGSSALVSNNDELKAGVITLGSGASQLKAGNQLVVDGLTQMASQVGDATTSISSYNTLISTLKNSNNATYIALADKIVTSGLTKEEVTAYNLASFGVKDALPSAYDLISQMSTSLTTLNTALTSKEGLVAGSKTIQVGLNNLDASVNGGTYISQVNGQVITSTISEANSLSGGINAYLAGASQINSGLATLNGISPTLVSGTSDLATGTKQLATQTPALTNGISALYQGANQLVDGTGKLMANNSVLLGGSNKLANGASQISDGASKLADGSITLGEGLTTLQDGANTLNSALSEGADEVNSINSSDKTYEMMSSPVDTSHEEVSTVKNNGHGMAPYMMSVGLYVACMAFTLMYPMYNDLDKAESGFKYWLSKASVWFVIATLASVVMIASLMFFCDFEPIQLLKTFIFAIIVGWASMALVTWLAAACGKIGDFVLLVFMVINLGGSAGTYPLETSSALFKAIHPFMPFTYSVDGFRKVISMPGATITTEIMVFIGIIIVCSLLTIVYYNYRIKQPKQLIPQSYENVNE